MKRIKTLILGLSFLSATSSLTAQNYDQVSNAPAYAQQAYYVFSTGNSINVANDAWDLAFTTAPMNVGIHLNESSSSSPTNPIPSLELYLTNASNFTQVLQSSDLSDRVYNPETNWSEGALNISKSTTNPFDMGWGIYNPSTHIIEGNKIFGIKLRSGSFKKFMIQSLAGSIYTLQVADLDNSNATTITLDKNSTNGSPFLYFSFTSGIVNTIPTQWDLVFQRYTTPLFDASTGAYVPYNVLGVLSGNKVFVARAKGVNPQTVAYSAYNDSLSNDMDKIGYDWKTFSNSWAVATDLAYFVKTADNHVWKMVFIDFEGSSTGISTFEKTDLGLATTIENSANSAKYWVYPTVTSGDFHFAIEDSKPQTYQLQLLSIEGKIVWETTILSTTSLNVFDVQLPNLSAGTYRLAIKGANSLNSQTLIIRP